VRNLAIGDRVLIPSTIACGSCVYCRAGYHAQCDKANPHGMLAGTAFYGGPEASGPFHGLQAEKARVPFAHVNLIKLPDEVSDDKAILLSDIFPTGYFGAHLAEIEEGDTVAVFGCGPVGQFAIASAKLFGASRVLAVDAVADRLEMARAQGAETIDFEKEDPVAVIRELTGGIGVDRVIDAVGVDAQHAHHGPAAKAGAQKEKQHQQVLEAVAPKLAKPDEWRAGDAPEQVLEWAIDAVDKAGTVSIIGVYPETMTTFPIGKAMNKNLTLKMGNCNHRRYIPELLEMVRAGVIDPRRILTKVEPLLSALDAYKHFDRHEPGWLKVELTPQARAAE
jgi:threonine dehydrogenase-like Zn-dependent dehydrogenase